MSIRKSCHGCADLEKQVFAVPGGKTIYRCLRFNETLSNSGSLGIWIKERKPGCWSEEK